MRYNNPDASTPPHLRVGRKYPNAWKLTEMFRENPPEPWPDWCFLPLAGAYAIVSGGGSRRVSIDDATDIAAVAALTAWTSFFVDVKMVYLYF